MIREECIKVLQAMWKYNECGYSERETKEALDMAIKVLEKEPCEDCVSRQAVLAIAGDSCLDLDSYENTKEFCEQIKELPPVTPVACIATVKFNKEDMRELVDEKVKELMTMAGDRVTSSIKQEPCDDCISRAQAINELQKICDDCDSSDYCGCCRIDTDGTYLDGADKMLKRLPSVASTRKKGKWVCKSHGFPPEPSIVCSVCGFDRDFNFRIYKKINYCPNCGAKMEVVKE